MNGLLNSRLSYPKITAVCLAALIGCSGSQSGPTRLPVSGTVTREGILVDDGTIMFTPMEHGPSVMGTIIDGKYGFTEEDGVPAGKYSVTINQNPLTDKTQGMGRQGPQIPDNRFKNKMPSGGWQKSAEIAAESDLTIDFALE